MQIPENCWNWNHLPVLITRLVVKKRRLRLLRHVERKVDDNWVKCCTMMEQDIGVVQGSLGVSKI